jgi:hypothetical protein
MSLRMMLQGAGLKAVESWTLAWYERMLAQIALDSLSTPACEPTCTSSDGEAGPQAAQPALKLPEKDYAKVNALAGRC